MNDRQEKRPMAQTRRKAPPVSKVEKNTVEIRGVPIGDLIAENSFAATFFTLLQGRKPDEVEEKLTGAVLVALVDHGIDTPSIHATLAVQRGGNPLNVAVGAGMLAFGDRHGGSIEHAARLFQDAIVRPGGAKGVADEIVGVYAASKRTVPGFGHHLHEEDPRAVALLEKARELGKYSRFCEVAVAVQQALEKRYRQRIPLNVHGAAAAVISELGFDWRLGRAFFIVARSVGTVAHAFEELRREAPPEDLGHVPWDEMLSGINGYDPTDIDSK